jgi:hypothetical protein
VYSPEAGEHLSMEIHGAPTTRLFKRLLRVFLPDFLRLVAPEVSARLGRACPVFLDKELLEQDRREADLLASLPLRGGGAVLVHVEIEARRRTRMLPRLREYAGRIQARHGGPVLSILLNLRGGKPGVCVEAPDGDLTGPGLNSFQYLAFNLSCCAAEEYLERPEPLAWALSRWSRPEHKLACLRKIAAAPLTDEERLLLMDCVETYLVLTADGAREYKRLEKKESEEGDVMQLTWSEKLQAQGRKEGRIEGARETLVYLLDQRFGPLPERVRHQVEGIASLPRLTRLAGKVLVASSLREMGFR